MYGLVGEWVDSWMKRRVHGWDGVGGGGTGWDGVKWDGLGWDWMSRALSRWDGMGWDEMG